MTTTLEQIRQLVSSGELRISEHGYDELSNDGICAREIVAGVDQAILVEDYPAFPKGPSVLLLQRDNDGCPIHAVWGIPHGHDRPAVLVTAYRPDPDRWDQDLRRRK